MGRRRATKITPQQQRVLDFIKSYRLEHGQSPRHTDIAKAIGHRHHGSVNAMIERMVERGFLLRLKRSTRSLYPA